MFSFGGNCLYIIDSIHKGSIYRYSAMKILKLDEFLRSFKQNIGIPHSLLLGAGASIESGIQSASDCIWDWKKEIFLSQNPTKIEYYANIKSDVVRKSVQRWLNDQGGYPAEGDDEEYAFYAEKALPIEGDRCKYFQKLISGANPSLGYHLIAYMAELGIVKSVWTTNFDGLMEKCAHAYKLAPISITAETATRIYRDEADGEILTIALHGDYKYGRLKNTATELDSQEEIFVKALQKELSHRDLIVIGYSGRDFSLMSALKKAYSVPGSGKLFWCGYGENVNESVCNLLETIGEAGRSAYYIPSNGFDETMYSIARYCFSDKKEIFKTIEQIKGRLVQSIDGSKSDFTSFEVNQYGKIVDTNLYPLILPQNCYQFEVKFTDDETAWDFCDSLYKNQVMAVPYRKMVYAWGDKHKILEICKGKLKSEIILTPLTKEIIGGVGPFKKLALETIVFLLANNVGLECNKEKIWDKQKPFKYRIAGNEIVGYEGVRLSIVEDKTFLYLSFSPTFVYQEGGVFTKEEKKQFADKFGLSINKGRPNSSIKNYIDKWVMTLIGSMNRAFINPFNEKDGSFAFKIGKNTANLKVASLSRSKLSLPETISSKRLVLSGFECNDPQLNFFNPQRETLATDFHPMRGLVENAPVDIPLNLKQIKSGISLGVICPQIHNQSFFDFLLKLNTPCDVTANIDYVIPFPGFYKAFKTDIEIPLVGGNKWKELDSLQASNARQFCELITKKIDQLGALSVDVVVIYIPKEYECFTSYTDEAETFDLHDYIKAYAAQKQIATQFVREKTIESDLLCQIMWALSLAIYVKSNRIPWLVSNPQHHTAFAGIGYSVQNTSNGSNVVIGCSHVYSADGQGLKYKLSKISDVTFDKKRNPYLSENEAYKLGLNIKELFYNSFSEMPKRVVIHKRTPFKPEEIKGLPDQGCRSGREPSVPLHLRERRGSFRNLEQGDRHQA